jgi:hypothetical protein
MTVYAQNSIDHPDTREALTEPTNQQELQDTDSSAPDLSVETIHEATSSLLRLESLLR